MRQIFLNPNLHVPDELSENLGFLANFQFGYIPYYDIPYTDSGIFVVSKRIKKIFDKTSKIDFSEVPVIMYDDLDRKNYFLSDGTINPEMPSVIRKLILQQPKDGFPSIFRTIEKSSQVFVAEELKNILEENDIKGCIFEEVEITPYHFSDEE